MSRAAAFAAAARGRRLGRAARAVEAMLVTAAVLAGCAGSEVRVTNRLVTPEQDRQDLQRALAESAITPAEYDRLLRRRVPP